MTAQIRHRYDSSIVLFTGTIPEAVAALKAGTLADLSGADLRYADLLSADLRYADLSGANLSYANLSNADLSGADLRYADLRSANLSGADLRSANLSGADLRSANLSGANLLSANLSGAKNLISQLDALKASDWTPEGIRCWKCFDGDREPPASWVLEPGEYITENVNTHRTQDCGCGVNVAFSPDWVRQNYRGNDLWECLIELRDLAGVVVPYGTCGKFRAERVKLVRMVGPATSETIDRLRAEGAIEVPTL